MVAIKAIGPLLAIDHLGNYDLHVQGVHCSQRAFHRRDSVPKWEMALFRTITHLLPLIFVADANLSIFLPTLLYPESLVFVDLGRFAESYAEMAAWEGPVAASSSRLVSEEW